MSKTGLVVEGGGMRGIYGAGVLDVLMENGISFDGIIGVSAGAIHGCSMVAGQNKRNLRYYKKYCADPRFMSIRSLLLTGEIVGRKFCYDTLPNQLDPFDYEAFKKASTKFYATCSNLETGKAEYIHITDMKKQMDALRASASLPYVSHIVDYEGMKLLDGGCADSIPVEAFRKMGYEKCVVVLTRDDSYVKEPEKHPFAKLFYRKYPRFIQIIKNRHNDYNETRKRIRELEKAGEIFVIQPTHQLQISRMSHDADEIQNTYDLGVKDTACRIEELKTWLQS